jgi:predicted nucleotide-binding protein (sugar kinase/HSP70/actin superfamily)
MSTIGVLKMLKMKIDNAAKNNCNYVIETSDIEAINSALQAFAAFQKRIRVCEISDEPIENKSC